MDQATTQLLANQLGLVSENGEFQPSDVAAALANRMSESNPMMASLFAQMLNRTQSVDEDDSDEYQDYELEIQRLKNMINGLRRQVASANTMANYIAEIFGACPSCWGLYRLCEHCHGKGLPGFTDPNIEELRAWVEPALKKGGFYIASQQ